MLLRTVLITWLLVEALQPAHAQKKMALLIGNQSYSQEVGPLKNPINDINLVAASLRKIGFKQDHIQILPNATRKEILRAVDRYARALSEAGPDAVGVFYYSGHGAANKRDNRNYLIPIEVKNLDADVWYDAVPLDRIVSTLAKLSKNAAQFVIFDACRNLLNMPTKGGKGFVPVSPKRGMLIAFSTDPGQTASDRGEGSGPYAAALAAEITKTGLDHLDVFQNVKERVYKKTKSQVPWERNGLLQRVYLAGRAETRPPSASAVRKMVIALKDVALDKIGASNKVSELARVGGREIYMQKCVSCHGRSGKGSADKNVSLSHMPDLTDADWIWGGKLDNIYTALKYGIRSNHPDSLVSIMPAFGRDQILTESQIESTVGYVLSLSGHKLTGQDLKAGQAIFEDNCSSCHGAKGKGDLALGAPNLTDNVWLYASPGSTDIEELKESVWISINTGRDGEGIMPSFAGELSDAELKGLAFYVHSLGGGQ